MQTNSPPVHQYKMDSNVLEQSGAPVGDLCHEAGEGLEAPLETVDTFHATLG
jgi:hypothetical protein